MCDFFIFGKLIADLVLLSLSGFAKNRLSVCRCKSSVYAAGGFVNSGIYRWLLPFL
jgi:hypothetical protein